MSSYSGGGYRLAGGISHVSSGSVQSYPTVLNSPIPSGGSYNWRQQVRDQNARRRGSRRGGGIKSNSRGGQSSYEMFDSSPHVSTTTIAPQCQGNMTLWSRTYLRGESFPLSDDIE